MGGFNPRPASARGATSIAQSSLAYLSGFNPRPASARGATARSRTSTQILGAFQSAPRVRTRGDFVEARRLLRHQLFQSAPRVRTRGDRWTRHFAPWRTGFNPRPASARGATGLAGQQIRQEQVSIRAPRPHAGRRRCCSGRRQVFGFNPRPASARGATPAGWLSRDSI